MRIKDRLKNKEEYDVLLKNEDVLVSSCDINLSSVFADSLEVRNILVEAINSSKNIFYLVKPLVDKNIIASYFESLLVQKDYKVVIKRTESVSFDDSGVNIVPNSRIEDIPSFLQRSILGLKSGVYGFTLCDFSEVLKKIKLLISLNHKNLQKEDVDFLFESTNSMFVYFDKNSDGLLYVSKIEEISKTSFESVSVFDLNIDESTLSDSKEFLFEKSKKEFELKQEEKVSNVDVTIDVEHKKINKYKLLKEKLKNKRSQVL